MPQGTCHRRWRWMLSEASSLFCYFECHLSESIRPDARTIGRARDTTLAIEHVGCHKNGSDDPFNSVTRQGLHRSGRPGEAASVISKQLSGTASSSGMINLKELSLVSGKAAWMAYLVNRIGFHPRLSQFLASKLRTYIVWMLMVLFLNDEGASQQGEEENHTEQHTIFVDMHTSQELHTS